MIEINIIVAIGILISSISGTFISLMYISKKFVYWLSTVYKTICLVCILFIYVYILVCIIDIIVKLLNVVLKGYI